MSTTSARPALIVSHRCHAVFAAELTALVARLNLPHEVLALPEDKDGRLPEADVARGHLPCGKNMFLGGGAFLGRPIKAAAQFNAQPIAGVDVSRECRETIEQELAQHRELKERFDEQTRMLASKMELNEEFSLKIINLEIDAGITYLDRICISMAAPYITRDLGLTPTAFGLANTIFYVGYMLFEVPSNLMLARLGARTWLARIMVTWGIASTATAFAGGATSLYVMRLLVGVAEAGFVPGVLLYLTYRSALEAAHVLLSVPFALTGGVYLLWALGYNFSVAVWVGFIALFGTAVQTGVVMVIYLEEAVVRKRASCTRSSRPIAVISRLKMLSPLPAINA